MDTQLAHTGPPWQVGALSYCVWGELDSRWGTVNALVCDALAVVARVTDASLLVACVSWNTLLARDA